MHPTDPLGVGEERLAEFNFAAVCGLTRRYGPSSLELMAMSVLRRWAVWLLPRRHRWRMSALAPYIREFDQSTSRPSTTK